MTSLRSKLRFYLASRALTSGRGSGQKLASRRLFVAPPTQLRPVESDPSVIADAAIRVMQAVAARSCGLEIDEEQSASLAAGLVRARRLLPPGPDAALAACASAIWSGSGAGLGASMRGVIGRDGAPLVRPAIAARALWALALARASGAQGFDADGPLLAGVGTLLRLSGPLGLDPDLDPTAPPIVPLLPLSSRPLTLTLADLVTGWGLDEELGLGGADPAVDALLGASLRLRDGPGKGGPVLWAWRDSGLAAVHGRAGALPTRLLLGEPSRIRWDLGTDVLVWGDGPDVRLRHARVDGRKARLSCGEDDGPRRQVLLDGSRLIVRDRGIDRLMWRFGPDLVEDGASFKASIGAASLVVKLDPSWSWSRVQGGLAGRAQSASPATEITSSFELRA